MNKVKKLYAADETFAKEKDAVSSRGGRKLFILKRSESRLNVKQIEITCKQHCFEI